MSRYISKADLIRLLRSLNRPATSDDTVRTLRVRLYAELRALGYSGAKTNITSINKFIREYAAKSIEEEIASLMRIPATPTTQPHKQTIDKELIAARKVISSINGKPLKGQTIESGKSPTSNRIFEFVKGSREFTITFTGPDDIKFKLMWNYVMEPFLKRITAKSEWMIVTEDEVQGERFQTISLDNIQELRQAFENCGLMSNEELNEEISNELDSSLFFGRQLIYMKKIRFVDVSDYRANSLKKLRVHHFFPYTHSVPYLDLSKYQIYKTVDECKNQKHCVVHALEQYGIDVSALIPNNYHKLTAIKDLGVDLCLRVPNSNGNDWIGNKDSSVKLVSYAEHCMVDEKVCVTEFYIQNYKKILSDRKNSLNWTPDQLTQIAGIRSDTGLYFKTRKPKYIAIEKVIDLLELTPIPLYDLLSRDSVDQYDFKTRELKTNQKHNDVVYVDSIALNPNSCQNVYKNRVIWEKRGNTKYIDFHTLMPNKDVSLREFNQFVKSLSFSVGDCSSYAAIAHNLFVNRVYSKCGVRELTGAVLSELDRFRRGGLFFANRSFLDEPVISLDVNSLFAHAMKSIKLPVGEPVTGEEALSQDIFYARVLRNDEEILLTNYSHDRHFDSLLFGIGWKGVHSEEMSALIDYLYEQRTAYKGTRFESFFKGLLCAPYGKTMEKKRKASPKIVHTSRALDYLRRNARIIKSFRKYDAEHVIFYKYKQFRDYSLIHVGLQVVEAARAYMKQIIERISVPVYYCQVDSLILKASDYEKVKHLLPLSNKIGDFKIEYAAQLAYIINRGTYLLYNDENDYKVRVIGKNKEFIKSIQNPIDYFDDLLN